MTPWLQKKYGGKPPEFIQRILDAKLINNVMGGQFVTPWNYDLLPAEDIHELEMYVDSSHKVSQLGSKENG